eukprot:gene12896-biopygen7342
MAHEPVKAALGRWMFGGAGRGPCGAPRRRGTIGRAPAHGTEEGGGDDRGEAWPRKLAVRALLTPRYEHLSGSWLPLSRCPLAAQRWDWAGAPRARGSAAMGSASSAAGPGAEHAAQRWESAWRVWRSSGGGSLQRSAQPWERAAQRMHAGAAAVQCWEWLPSVVSPTLWWQCSVGNGRRGGAGAGSAGAARSVTAAIMGLSTARCCAGAVRGAVLPCGHHINREADYWDY